MHKTKDLELESLITFTSSFLQSSFTLAPLKVLLFVSNKLYYDPQTVCSAGCANISVQPSHVLISGRYALPPPKKKKKKGGGGGEWMVEHSPKILASEDKATTTTMHLSRVLGWILTLQTVLAPFDLLKLTSVTSERRWAACMFVSTLCRS